MIMPEKSDYIIFPLGDHALTVDFGNSISDAHHFRVLNLFRDLREHPLPGMVEAVPAYSSLTIYYKPLKLMKKMPAHHTVYETMKLALEERLVVETIHTPAPGRLIRIPVCYEEPYAMDLAVQSEKLGIPAAEIIRLHLSLKYKVYMLGFIPGFSYMGEVDEKIAMPRKATPVIVEPGSVGIAGRQTGIYPFSSPGGWNILGRTPVLLFDPHSPEPVLLQVGDSVEFYQISQDEFENYQAGDT